MASDTLNQVPKSTVRSQGTKELTIVGHASSQLTNSQPRALTIHADNPQLHVGRSSRNASKGLVAASDNAWFDSPTMSRQHASFSMTSESPRTILLEDLHSTHGTFVQGRRLDTDEAYTCSSGISITFGQKVTSGAMTFPAREFLLGIEWQSPSPLTPSSSPPALQKTSKIGFCVPDDEGETSEDRSREPSVQIVEVGRRTFSVPDSPSSEDVYDSNDDSVEMVQTAGNSSISTTPDHLIGSGGKDQGSQKASASEDVQSNHKTLKIACLLTNSEDQTEVAAGTSSFNPIELDKEIARRRESAIVESEDDGPEVLQSKPVIFTDNQAEVTPTSIGGHLQPPQLSLQTEHKIDKGEDTRHGVIPDSDIDDFANNLYDEIGEDELYQLTEPHVDGQPLFADVGGVRVHKMVKFLDQAYDSEDSDDDDNENEDEDDCLTQFHAEYEEGQTLLAEGTTNSSKGSFQLGTEQVNQGPLVMVENSQFHGQMPPRISTAGPINVGTLPAFINVDHRAPSPSDAALAKKPSFPRIRLSTGEDTMHPRAITQMSIPQDIHDKGHPAGPQPSSGFQSHHAFPVPGFTDFEDYRGQKSIFDDSDHFPDYKVGPFSSRPARCSTLPSLVAACEQFRSNDLRVQHYLGPAASKAKASSISGEDIAPAQGADYNAEQFNKPQRPFGPSPALSIKDLVGDNNNDLPSTLRGLKRKAAEISLSDKIMAAPEEESMQQNISTQASVTTSQESFLQDAQLRDSQTSIPQHIVLKFCDGNPEKPEATTVGAHEEPARKKIKTAAKRPSRFGAFISGFVVGGLSLAGAFVALVATVPNSVREETWREFGHTG